MQRIALELEEKKKEMDNWQEKLKMEEEKEKVRKQQISKEIEILKKKGGRNREEE